MKTRYRWFLVGSCVAALLLFRLERASAAVTFSAGIQIQSAADFYDPLAPYGQWVTVGSYGRCWHPTDITEAGWRPYGYGHWEWTDCGWYWVSDEPWAWACYHYGSWVFDPTYGWIWVPGTEWAPAWVVWRESPDYIGWAPCGPSGVVVSPSLFCFIDIHRFHDRIRPGELVVNNTTIINRTRVISGIRRESRSFDGRRERVVVNTGPDVKFVQRGSGATFTQRPVRDVVRDTPLPQRMISRAEPWRRENALTVQEPARTRNNVQEQPRTRTEERQQPRTGREQPRSYEQKRTQPQTTPAPSGRDQQRIYQQPQRTTPATPTEPTRRPPTTTGRDEQRNYERTPSRPVEPPVTPTPPERRPSQPVVPERPTPPVTPERPVPPTARENREIPHAPPRAFEERPVQRETPARPVERPVEPERGRDRDRDKP